MDIYKSFTANDFLLALLAGALIALLYDAFRFLRILFRVTKGVTAVFDIIFMSASAAVTFLLFLTVSFGYFRLVIFLSELMGFCIYYLTLGFITAHLEELLSRISQRIFGKMICLVKKSAYGLSNVIKSKCFSIKKKKVCAKPLEK